MPKPDTTDPLTQIATLRRELSDIQHRLANIEQVQLLQSRRYHTGGIAARLPEAEVLAVVAPGGPI